MSSPNSDHIWARKNRWIYNSMSWYRVLSGRTRQALWSPGGENCLTQLAVLSAIGGNRGGVLGLTSNYCDIIYWLSILFLFEAIIADMSRLGHCIVEFPKRLQHAYNCAAKWLECKRTFHNTQETGKLYFQRNCIRHALVRERLSAAASRRLWCGVDGPSMTSFLPYFSMISDTEVKQPHLVRFQFGVFIKLQALSRSVRECYWVCVPVAIATNMWS